MKNIVLIYNSNSSKIKRKKLLSKIVKKLEKENFSIYTIPFLEFLEKDHFNFIKESQALFIVGGDGTLNGVVNKLLKNKIEFPPIVIYPGGTSNDFARIWWNKKNISIKEILKSIEKQKYKYIDVGNLNGEYFVNVAGCGMFIDVASKTPAKKKQKLGFLAYLHEAIKKLNRYDSFKITLKYEEKEVELDTLLFLVLNSKGAGGVKKLVPDGAMDNGTLDLLLFTHKKQNRIYSHFIKTLYYIFKNSHLNKDYIQKYRLKNFTIKLPEKMEYTLDGENIVGKKKLEFKVEESKLPLFYLK